MKYLLLFLISCNANAANWQVIGQTIDGDVLQVDTQSLYVQPKYVTANMQYITETTQTGIFTSTVKIEDCQLNSGRAYIRQNIHNKIYKWKEFGSRMMDIQGNWLCNNII